MKRLAFIFAITILASAGIRSEELSTCVNEGSRINILIDEKPLDNFAESSFVDVGDREVKITPISDQIGLRYIEGIFDEDELKSLIQFCENRSGWQRSQVMRSMKLDDDDPHRTSSSCPLIFSLHYHDKIGLLPDELQKETQASWNATNRVARLFDILPSQVEPLQVIHYQPGQYYKAHHDYHSNPETESLQGKQRVYTLLVMASNVPETDGGGYLHFPKLNIKILPKFGDAVAWKNLNEKGYPEPLSLHEGMMLEKSEKYAINVWTTDSPYS